MTRAKICGVCRPQDAAVAGAAGADYLGVILAEGFPRTQSLNSAERIFDATTVSARVGVMIEPTVQQAVEARRVLNLDVIQLHGHESPGLVRELSDAVRVWKAVRIRSSSDLTDALDLYGDYVHGLLLDRYDPGSAGGSGRQFDWAELAEVRRRLPNGIEVIVAGGLNPQNVASAIKQLGPDVVDVSSGVESSVGIKSPELVRAFLQEAHSVAADRRVNR